MDQEEIISRVRRPGRYLGCEVNAVKKDPAKVHCRVALAYPDLYEVGMSYLGLQVLYAAVNDQEGLWAERVFAPDRDMEAELRRSNLPLCSLESHTPLTEFDLVGFTLQHELNYLDVLSMIQQGKIPLRACERKDHHPIVIAGGPCASNPEPIADALDAVFLGDGEEGLSEIARCIGTARRQKWCRQKILDQLQSIAGIYIPGRYEMIHSAHGIMQRAQPLGSAPAVVRRRLVPDINHFPPPGRSVVPCVLPIHDRLAIEIQRGCTRGCRFCHAGMINRPVRQRSALPILDAVRAGIEHTGHDQISFLSLSAGDHPNILPILARFFEEHRQKKISASLPSLRAETLTADLVDLVRTVRKTGFTIAPEAGTARLRRVINKSLTEEDIFKAVSAAFDAGWRLIKLYFMIGLPTETVEDQRGIVDLVTRLHQELRKRKRHPIIHVGVSTFVPKPHTPFQWERMIAPQEALQIQKNLRQALQQLSGVKVGWTQPWMSWVEGVLSRGDRRLFNALVSLVESGQRLSEWSEHFQAESFSTAFEALNLPEGMDGLIRARDLKERLPWDHLDMGPSRDFLKAERDRAYSEIPTPDCAGSSCENCGACDPEHAQPMLDHEPPEMKPGPVPKTNSHPTGQPLLLRLTLAKEKPAIYLGHMEFSAAVMRAMRRAGWPLSYSQGFHPKPKMSWGPACPVGVESRSEIVELSLTQHENPGDLLERLKAELPPGVVLLLGEVIPEGMGFSSKRGTVVRYRLRCPPGNCSNTVEKTRALLASSSWRLTRRDHGVEKIVDLRPSIKNLSIHTGSGAMELVCELRLDAAQTARPGELAREIFGTEQVQIIREAVQFQFDSPEGPLPGDVPP